MAHLRTGGGDGLGMLPPDSIGSMCRRVRRGSSWRLQFNSLLDSGNVAMLV